MESSVTSLTLSQPSTAGASARSSSAATAPNGLFAQQLLQAQAAQQAAQRQKTSSTAAGQPTDLTQGAASVTTAADQTATVAASEEKQATETPKIARNWRMESAEKTTAVQEDATLEWDDFLDLVNPLQHIPVIGTLYRELTGDTIKPEVQIAGSVAFGALTGSLALSVVSGIASAAYEQKTGEEPTVQIAQALFGDDVVGGPAPSAGTITLADAGAATQAATASQGTTASALAATAKTRSTTSSPTALASVEGTRMGNVVYTSPLLRSAAKIAPTGQKTALVTPAKNDVATATAAEATATSTPTSAQQERPTDAAIGAMFQEQAKSKEAGNALPPELVQDMMMMALDKYKAAHTLGGDAATTP